MRLRLPATPTTMVLLLAGLLLPGRPAPGEDQPASAIRPAIDLSGAWDFRADPADVGKAERWWEPGVAFEREITVPGAWNAQGVGTPAKPPGEDAAVWCPDGRFGPKRIRDASSAASAGGEAFFWSSPESRRPRTRSTSSARKAGSTSAAASRSSAWGSVSTRQFRRTRVLSGPDDAERRAARSSTAAEKARAGSREVPSVSIEAVKPARPALSGGSAATPAGTTTSMDTMGTAWFSTTRRRAPSGNLASDGTGAEKRSSAAEGGGLALRKAASGASSPLAAGFTAPREPAQASARAAAERTRLLGGMMAAPGTATSPPSAWGR